MSFQVLTPLYGARVPVAAKKEPARENDYKKLIILYILAEYDSGVKRFRLRRGLFSRWILLFTGVDHRNPVGQAPPGDLGVTDAL